MKEIGPQHNFSYRKEELTKIFNLIQKAESGYVVGIASVGKTRFIDFIMRNEVQKYYLGEEKKSALLVLIDSNSISGQQDYSFYRLMLQSLKQACGKNSEFSMYQSEFANLDSQVNPSNNKQPELQHLQIAVEKICQQHKVCFIFDEFDEAYKNVSNDVLANLYSIWETNKNSLCYILFLRELPNRLRSPSDNENFYRLISRSMIGLRPYNQSDSLMVLQQVEKRWARSLTPEQHKWFFYNAGGHVGLIIALLYVLSEGIANVNVHRDTSWIVNLNIVYQETKKIWVGLEDQEKIALVEFVRDGNISNEDIYKLLLAKGIIVRTKGAQENIFSPIFQTFISQELLKNIEKKELEPSPSLKVFLCHSSYDKPRVNKLYKELSKIKGLDIWYDNAKLVPGDDWNYVITKELEETHIVIVCLSRNSINKEGYIQKEIRRALDIAEEKPEGTIFLIPLKLEECDVPKRLSQWHWLDYFSEGAINKLLLALKNRASSLGIDVQ